MTAAMGPELASTRCAGAALRVHVDAWPLLLYAPPGTGKGAIRRKVPLRTVAGQVIECLDAVAFGAGVLARRHDELEEDQTEAYVEVLENAEAGLRELLDRLTEFAERRRKDAASQALDAMLAKFRTTVSVLQDARWAMMLDEGAKAATSKQYSSGADVLAASLAQT